MWGVYVDENSSEGGLTYVMQEVYLFRAHANNVKCI